MSNSIEEELWRIYTFYTLHADPTVPEQLKVPSFIRFSKDCQIISSRLKGATIELEVARVVRIRSRTKPFLSPDNVDSVQGSIETPARRC